MLRILVLILIIVGPTSLAALECPLGFKRPNYPNRSSFCTAGRIADYYNFDKKIPCSDMEVDHLIPLKLAHCYGLEGERLKQFANDPRNLRFTHRTTNRQKGAKSLEEFLDTLPANMQKRVLLDGIEVMEAYGLPVNKKLRTALLNVAKAQRTELSQKRKTISELKKSQLPPKVKFKGEMIPPKRAIKKTGAAIATRTSLFAGRELSILPLENIPMVGLAFSLAFIGWDLKDSCDTLKDLNELEASLFPEDAPEISSNEVCGLTVPTLDEVKDKITDKDQLLQTYEELKTSILEQKAEVELPEFPELPKWSDIELPTIGNPLKKIWGD